MAAGQDERAERLAAQLRANLKRRKAQARAVAAEPVSPDPADPSTDQRTINSDPRSTAADAPS